MGCGGRGTCDRVDSRVINEVTKGVDRSMKGRQEKYARVCMTSNGGVGQSLEVSKAGAIVDDVMIVEVPREGKQWRSLEKAIGRMEE